MPRGEALGFGAGAARKWTPWELNAWRRVESSWACLCDPRVELSRAKTESSDWEYGLEATGFLDALDNYFERIDARLRAEKVPWGKPVFTQCLTAFEDASRISDASLWDMVTFLRATTRFPRFPDNNDGGWFADFFYKGSVEAAMSRLKVLASPAIEDVGTLLAFKTIFDGLSLQEFREWQGGGLIKLEGGGEALHVPWPQYHPVVNEWSCAVYESLFYIDPYHGLGPTNSIPHARFLDIGSPGGIAPRDFFAGANLDEVRQYMAVCIRGEKWCDGHIAGEFERGVIQASFERLEQLMCLAG